MLSDYRKGLQCVWLKQKLQLTGKLFDEFIDYYPDRANKEGPQREGWLYTDMANSP